MDSHIGFVLLVNPYNRVEQSERLIRTLNRMFDHPPIACHHDFGKNPRFIEDCPANVRLVRPHVDTQWGDFSCVDAMIQALRLLYEGSDGPEWFVFLSGSDYPVKPGKVILSELQKGGFDGYIEHRLVSEGEMEYPRDLRYPEGWKGKDWLRQCRKRYCSRRFNVPGINRYLRFSKRTLWSDHPILTKGRLPFSAEFKCYAGEVWFTANNRCARHILDFYSREPQVAEHYRTTLVPEESYLQTVLGNATDLELSQNSLRYVNWSRGGSNPRVLTTEDLPKLRQTGAHFARKFDQDVDAYVLDALDVWTS